MRFLYVLNNANDIFDTIHGCSVTYVPNEVVKNPDFSSKIKIISNVRNNYDASYCTIAE